MKHIFRKVTDSQIADMKKLREQGYSYGKISSQLNIPRNTIIYHLDPKTKKACLTRAKNYIYKDLENHKLQRKKYMASPAGKKAVARSYVRYYLKHEILTREDIIEVLEEFPQEAKQ